MAPRETYDPEDIESLLNERGFDELLAEERAFVLRHINGRDEYEHLRAILHRVKEDEGAAGQQQMAVDNGVRDHLMQVFREQQVPTWRIWLNSVKAFMIPEQASAFWRPALALASVALLVTFGVVGWQRITAGSHDMAELKKEEVKPTMEKPTGDAPSIGDANTALEAENSEAKHVSPDLTADKNAWSGLAELKENGYAAGEGNISRSENEYDRVFSQAAAVEEAPASFDVAMDTIMMPVATGAATASGVVNYVEKDQLLSNQSIANVSDAVVMREVASVEAMSKSKSADRKKAEAQAAAVDESRSVKEDEQLLELLNAAW